MSRRSRSPGPVRDSQASPKGRFRNTFKSNWISVNPCPGGVLPTNVNTLSGNDIDNGTPGVWYHYDPNDVFDISGHASDWVARDADGIEFYVDFSAMQSTLMRHDQMGSGRCATALTKPDGTGVLAFSDMVGCTIEFLIESHENTPANQNEKCGIMVSITNHDGMSVTNDGFNYQLGLFYQNNASSNPDQRGVFLVSPHAQTTTLATVADCVTGWALFHFAQKSATEVISATSVALSLKSDGTMTHHFNQAYNQQKQSDPMPMNDKVYLVVAPFAYSNAGTAGAGVGRTGKFKVWYRMIFSEDEFEPTYDPGSNNRRRT